MNENTNNTSNRTWTPSYIVWFAPDRENAPWTRIGAQWPTKNGKSFRQVLTVVPSAPGRIFVRPNESKTGAAA